MRDSNEVAFALGQVFGGEWEGLTTADQDRIIRDCTEDGGVEDFAAYRRRIGAGNLEAYAKVMRARFARVK